MYMMKAERIRPVKKQYFHFRPEDLSSFVSVKKIEDIPVIFPFKKRFADADMPIKAPPISARTISDVVVSIEKFLSGVRSILNLCIFYSLIFYIAFLFFNFLWLYG